MSTRMSGESPRMWAEIKRFVRAGEIVIDRPAGSHHPVHVEIVYPLDYGHLVGTRGGDGEGIDVWRGSGDPILRGLVATFDAGKGDAEVKYLFALTDAELQEVRLFYTEQEQAWVLLERVWEDSFEPPTRVVRVFHDWGHFWPLWESGTDTYCREPGDYGLSDELTSLLRECSELFAAYNVAVTGWTSPDRRREYDARMRRAVEQLRREIGHVAVVQDETR